MKGLRAVAFAAGLGAALVLGLVTGINGSRVSAQAPTVSVGSTTIAVGGQGSVALQALDMAAPGLGAWSMNIVYDPGVVTQVGCTPQSGSVCNPNFAADTIRVTGASAGGLEGDTTLATFAFRCTSVGTSALTLSVDTLADATPGSPQPITAATTNGSVTCQEPPTPPSPPPPTATQPPGPTPTPVVVIVPSAGFGPFDSGGPSVAGWFIAGLAGAGIAWLTAGLAGLAGVTGSNAPRARTSRVSTRSGFVPRMKPLAPPPASPPTDAPSFPVRRAERRTPPDWRELPTLDNFRIDGFRPPRRPR